MNIFKWLLVIATCLLSLLFNLCIISKERLASPDLFVLIMHSFHRDLFVPIKKLNRGGLSSKSEFLVRSSYLAPLCKSTLDCQSPIAGHRQPPAVACNSWLKSTGQPTNKGWLRSPTATCGRL